MKNAKDGICVHDVNVASLSDIVGPGLGCVGGLLGGLFPGFQAGITRLGGQVLRQAGTLYVFVRI